MELKKIETKEDIEIVKSFFYKIFWDETDYNLIHFKHAITGKHTYKRLEYYFGYENNTVVGITGIYAQKADECWLGWFGIRPEYRHKGYATKMLNLTLQTMKNDGYKVCRLYTDTVVNKEAVSLYLKKGFHTNSEYQENIITMAKTLTDKIQVSQWKGKPLAFRCPVNK